MASLSLLHPANTEAEAASDLPFGASDSADIKRVGASEGRDYGSHHHCAILASLAVARAEDVRALDAVAAASLEAWLLPSCRAMFAALQASGASRVRTRRGVLHFSLDRAWRLKRQHPGALILEFGVFKGGDLAYLAKAVATKKGGEVRSPLYVSLGNTKECGDGTTWAIFFLNEVHHAHHMAFSRLLFICVSLIGSCVWVAFCRM
jgi:hypothetical protein